MRSYNQMPPARIIEPEWLTKLLMLAKEPVRVLPFWSINRCEEVLSTLSPWQTRYVDQKVQEVVASPLPFFPMVLRSDILCRFCGGQQGPERTESIVNTLSIAVLYKAIRVMPPAPGAAVGPDGGSAGCSPSVRPPRPGPWVNPPPKPIRITGKPIRIAGDLPPEWGKQLIGEPVPKPIRIPDDPPPEFRRPIDEKRLQMVRLLSQMV